jgi:hypothetical protein
MPLCCASVDLGLFGMIDSLFGMIDSLLNPPSLDRSSLHHDSQADHLPKWRLDTFLCLIC